MVCYTRSGCKFFQRPEPVPHGSFHTRMWSGTHPETNFPNVVKTKVNMSFRAHAGWLGAWQHCLAFLFRHEHRYLYKDFQWVCGPKDRELLYFVFFIGRSHFPRDYYLNPSLDISNSRGPTEFK